MGVRQVTLRWAVVLSGAALGACGQQPTMPGMLVTPEGRPDGGSSRDIVSSGAAPDASSQGTGSTGTVCSSEATRLYLFDTSGVLHAFDPTRLPSSDAFTTIGTVNCARDGGPWASASSMAIDHDAVAWISDRNGLLFKVSTADARCERTTFKNQHGFTEVGMGFAGDVTKGTETLYVVDNSVASLSRIGQGLGSVDLGSLTLRPIANFDGALAGLGAELTGTGDGRLFGFFPLDSSIDEIDPTTAHILSSTHVALPDAVAPGEYDFAFSFWGGVFFLYTASTANPAGATTDVTAFDPIAGTTKLILSQIGFKVIGAGSSTCVPAKGEVHALGEVGLAPGDSDAGDPTDGAVDAFDEGTDTDAAL